MKSSFGAGIRRATVLRIFLPFTFGYFLSYVFRVVNAVIAPDIARDLGIGPADLGLVTSSYFISFAAAQLPLGIFLDRLGPRVVEAFLLLFAGAGAVVFAVSDSLTGLILGRGLIGFGVSACLMAAFKNYVIWFPSKILARVNGFQVASGGMGALAAASPVEWALGITGWRGLFWGLAILSFGIAALIFLVVPESPDKKSPEKLSDQVQGIVTVFKSPVFWRITPLATLSLAGYASLQGLWAGPWLRDVAGLGRKDVAAALSESALAMIAGYILSGFLAERLSRRNIPVMKTAAAGMAGFMAVLSVIAFDLPVSPWITMGFFGFFGTMGILAYTSLTLAFPPALSGRATTGLNMLVFAGAFAVQWAIGIVINLWEVSAGNTYDPAGYRAAFSGLLLCQAAALVWFWISGRRPDQRA